MKHLALLGLFLSTLAFGAVTETDIAQVAIPRNFLTNGGFESGTAGLKYLYSNLSFATTGVNAATDTITTASNHGLTDGTPVEFSSTTTVPGGITAGTTYYVINSTSTTFKISTTIGGSAVDITSVGTGTHMVHALVPTPNMSQGLTVRAASLVPSISTSSPLSGNASLLLTKGAADTAGEGPYFPFTIDSASQGKTITVEFDYSLVSGAFTAATSNTGHSSIEPWIWDATNSTLIQPAPQNLTGGSIVGGKSFYQGSFQAASNSTSYWLILHQALPDAVAYVQKLDNLRVYRGVSARGAPVTDEVAYTPTITGFGTTSAVTFYYRRDGGYIHVRGNFTSGTATAVTASVSLPPGLTTASTISSSGEIAGQLTFGATGAPETHTLKFPSDGNIYFGVFSGSLNGLAKRNGSDFFNTTVYSVDFTAPITGWGSSVVMSNDTATNVVAARFNNSATAINGTQAKVVWTNTDKLDGGITYSSGTATIPTPGWYDVSASVYVATTPAVDDAAVLSIYKNGSPIKDTIWRYKVASATTASIPISDSFYFNAGDTLEVWLSSGGTSPSISSSNTRNTLSITRRSGPSSIAASETISAKYTGTSFSGTAGVVILTTKAIDSHGAYNTSTGLFTAPSPGTYRVDGLVQSGATSYAAGGYLEAYASVNGSGVSTPNILGGSRAETTAAVNRYAAGSTLVKLNAGDTVALYVSSSSSTALAAASMTITRVGN